MQKPEKWEDVQQYNRLYHYWNASHHHSLVHMQMQGERTKTEMAIDYVTQKMNLHTGLCMSSAIPISTRTERNRPDK